MRFLYPQILFLLLLLPLVALLKGRSGKSAALTYSTASLVRRVGAHSRSTAGRILLALRLLALTLLIIALARPQWGRGTTEIEASGIDIVLAVDISGSMEALDLTLKGQPANRLEVVKTVIKKFIEERPSDRIALLAFAGRPYLVSPLTLDHDWLILNLDRLRTGMVEDGTAIGSAIAASVNRLREQKAKSKIVILLTDGVNNAGQVTPIMAAEAARALGIKVYTIGVGTQGIAPIPARDPFGNRVIAQMRVDVDEPTLEKIAEITGAKFFRATDTTALENVYAQIDKLEKTEVKMKKFEHYSELFHWLLIPGLILLGLELLLANTRYRRLP
ncbi:VWA domain-containing protein [Kamptonema cortianum]|nr:VWA domain-containing protein [Kamptonema cortianum]